MDHNYIKLNLPNIITITLIAYTMTFVVGWGARTFKSVTGGANG